MALFAFVIYPTGEEYTREILRLAYKSFHIVDIIRHRTAKYIHDFHVKIFKTNPKKISKLIEKAAAQGNSSSFLVILVEGDKIDIGDYKDAVRDLAGCNCIHSADNRSATMDHLSWLFRKEDLRSIDLGAAKKIELERVFDFSHWEFCIAGKELHNGVFESLNGIFRTLEDNDINYAVSNLPQPTVYQNVYEGNKDIEIVCSDRTRAIDILGGVLMHMSNPHTYLVRVRKGDKDKKVKLDFSLGVIIPGKWRDNVLATKRKGPEGFYIPTDENRYWLTIYERIIDKPRKYGVGRPKYGEGAEWEDLVRWGVAMGLRPLIKPGAKIRECQSVFLKHMKENGYSLKHRAFADMIRKFKKEGLSLP